MRLHARKIVPFNNMFWRLKRREGKGRCDEIKFNTVKNFSVFDKFVCVSSYKFAK